MKKNLNISNKELMKNVMSAGILTSCRPRKAPKTTACIPSEI